MKSNNRTKSQHHIHKISSSSYITYMHILSLFQTWNLVICNIITVLRILLVQIRHQLFLLYSRLQNQLLKGHLFIQEILLNIYYQPGSGGGKAGIETVMAYAQVGVKVILNKHISNILPTNVCIVKATVFPVVSESWTVKKAQYQRIGAFELWCRIRLLKSSLDCKEIKPDQTKGNQP